MPELRIVFDSRFKSHDTGPWHPERPQRLDAIADALQQTPAARHAHEIQPRRIALGELSRVHQPEYITRVRRACERRAAYIDSPDSAISGDSYDVALLAAGAVADAARWVAGAPARRAFCAVRPPGHHAEYDRSLGFCLFNNIVIAARTLRDDCDVHRMLILDWDVHHGNGTQHLLESDPDVLCISIHGHPDHTYPGTGYAHERGIGPGEGSTINLPLMPGATDDDVHQVFAETVNPAIDAFQPELVLISAGFDAHADDPLGNLEFSDHTFAWMLERLLHVANQHARGRVLSVLEGGYDLDTLRRCVSAHVAALAG